MCRTQYRGIRVTPAAANELTKELLDRPRFVRGTADPYVQSFEKRVRNGELRPQLHLTEYLAARQDAGEGLPSLLPGLWAIESFLRSRGRVTPVRPVDLDGALETAHRTETLLDGALDCAQVRHLSERSIPALAEMRRKALEYRYHLDELIAIADQRLFGAGVAA